MIYDAIKERGIETAFSGFTWDRCQQNVWTKAIKREGESTAKFFS